MKNVILFSALLSVVAVTGCTKVHQKVEGTHRAVVTGHPGGAYEPKNVNKYDLENREPLVLLDSGVQRSVTSAGPIQQRITEDGRLEVLANLRNRENRRIQVQVNCVFKDDQGFVVDETPFQTLILTENAQEGVRFISMNDKARKFTIRVRQAR